MIEIVAASTETMGISRRQIVTALSVVYLSALTILAAFALHSAHVYSLPIADIVAALAVALPPLAGVAMEAVINLNESLAAKGQLQTSRIFQVVITAFVVYEAVLATLAGTHISPPGSLTCALRDRWEHLFRNKDRDSIRRIQDGFNCCGLRSPRDMAFPFPDHAHGVDTCMITFDRDRACMEPWKSEERKVAVMLLVVPLAVFLWKVVIILAPSSGSAWLPSTIRLPIEDGTASGPRRRPAIEYQDAGSESDSVRAEVDRLNKDSNLASHIEGGRSRSSGLWREHEYWREPGEAA